jgi:uncharacterized protein (TIGR03437 family)
MGLIFRRAVLMLSLAVVASAAPKLRLSTAAVGPVFITAGQNGNTQSISAANIGDGSLNLSASSTASWINVTFGVVKSCVISNTSFSSCVPVNIGLATNQLGAGSYTGIVTLTDPKAIDSPQTFTVTVQVGSAVPSSIDLYLAPGGTASSSFVTGSTLTTNVVNAQGGPVVSIAAPNAGSFATSYSYQVTASASSSIAPNNYVSNIGISGSATSGDNKTVAVTSHVTALPIVSVALPASALGGTVQFQIAQSGQPQSQNLTFANAGSGTLALSQVSNAPAWLKTSTTGNILTLTADPTGLSPGANTATISVTSNAVNSPTSISISLNVLATGPPVVSYQQVVDDVLFAPGDPVAPGGWIAVFGQQLHVGAPILANVFPLGGTLGGAMVLVNGSPAPLYYVSESQINFQMPYATPPGDATVQVNRDGQTGNTVSVKVAPAAPRLLVFSYPGLQGYAEAYLNSSTVFAVPVTAGISSGPAHAGDTLVFFAFGLGQTVPAATDGAAPTASPIPGTPHMIIGQSSLPTSGVTISPSYAGLTPGSVGVYQINVPLPSNVPRGNAVSAMFDMGNGVFSNRVAIAIQ